MKSENWDTLSSDDKIFLQVMTGFMTVALSAGGVMSIIKLSTEWEANWAFVLMPTYIPIFIAITGKFCYRTMRRMVA